MPIAPYTDGRIFSIPINNRDHIESAIPETLPFIAPTHVNDLLAVIEQLIHGAGRRSVTALRIWYRFFRIAKRGVL